MDFAILKQDGLILVVAVAFIVSRALGKTLGIKIGAKISNSDPNIGKYLGLALLPQGGISIGLLTIVAMDASVLHQSIAAVIMLSILFYETLGPVFAKYAISQAGEMYGLDSLEESMFEEDVVEKEKFKMEALFIVLNDLSLVDDILETFVDLKIKGNPFRISRDGC